VRQHRQPGYNAAAHGIAPMAAALALSSPAILLRSGRAANAGASGSSSPGTAAHTVRTGPDSSGSPSPFAGAALYAQVLVAV
jgi:hypothetical protein